MFRYKTVLRFILQISVGILTIVLLNPFFLSFSFADNPAPKIIIIDVDDRSIESIGRWPWSRDVHAKLIRVLNKLKVKFIVFDFLFSEPDERYPEKDRILIDAVGKSKNIFLSYAFYSHGKSSDKAAERDLLKRFLMPFKGNEMDIRGAKRLLLPTRDLLKNARGIGFVNVFTEAKVLLNNKKGADIDASSQVGGIVRKFPMLVEFEGGIYPSLPLIVAAEWLNLKANEIRLENGIIRMGGYSIPIDDEGDMELEFEMPFTRFMHFSYIDLLTLDKPGYSRDFKDAIVIVSFNATGLSDYKVTPVSNYFPGSELIATAIDNILKQ